MKLNHKSFISAIFFILILLSVCMAAQENCARVSTNVTFYFGIETPIPDPNHPVTVDLFHADLELSFRPAGWDVVVSYDRSGTGSKGIDIQPQEALLYGNFNCRWVLSWIPHDFEFIGAGAGETFWILPQNVIADVLPLGIAAEQAESGRLCPWNPGDPRGADTTERWFEFRLLDVRGPADANFAMWQADGINPPVVFMSTQNNGITEEDVYYISDGSHVHMNWGFTKAGLYEVDFQVSTILLCEKRLTADWAPLGNEFYNGDCKVDFLDFTHLAEYWLEYPSLENTHTWMFVDPNDLDDLVNMNELKQLTEQWLDCGYPGCRAVNNKDTDPNELNKN
jgi:hypothetical protein